MVKGKLKNGFDIIIEDENLDDFEVLEALCDIDEDSSNITKIIFVYKRLLGEEQYGKLKEHMRNKSGKISTTEMAATLDEIINMGDETKNS